MSDFRQGGTNRFGGGHGGHGGGFGGRGGRPSFGGGNRGGFRGGDRDRGPVTMHKVTCDECKKPCEVPFLPTAGKPVYCSACFGGKREGGNDRGGDRFPKKSFGGGDYRTPPRTDFGADVNKVSGSEIKKQIEVLNVKIDRLSKIIEDMAGVKSAVAPAPVKPVVVAPVKEAVKVVAKVVAKVAPAKKAVKKVSKK
ncbi:MAG: CxxC-x17-CxxC domain-containing protein [bacterium]